MEQLMKIADIAKLLAVESSTLRKWIYLGKLPKVKVGGATRIRQSDVEAMVRDNHGIKDVN